jgi:hemin uptake protein HemP
MSALEATFAVMSIAPQSVHLPVRAPAPTPVRISSEALLRGASVLEISHNGQLYRLQVTALDKLILTK